MAKKNGRPNEFKEEYILKAQEYIDQCVDGERDYVKTTGKTGTSHERVKIVKLPTIEGFAIYLGVAVSSLYLWKDQNDNFSEALENIKTEQKNRLIEKGLAGEYNPTIAKLILSANHGLREGQSIEHTGKDGGPMEVIDTREGYSFKDLEAKRQALIKDHRSQNNK